MERQDFRIDVLREGEDVVVLRVAGEIDLCSSFSFREQLSRAVEGGAPQVVLDLSEAGLIDSAGLSVLAGVARRLFLEARDFVVICPENRLRRVLALTRLDRLVPILGRTGGRRRPPGNPIGCVAEHDPFVTRSRAALPSAA